jgi:fucose 4-O-acetylase-like acetyltransferase
MLKGTSREIAGFLFSILYIMTRIPWIDNCKALTISLVALGHVQSIYLVNEIIFSFVMPTFFFLSGFTFERSSKAPFVELLRKKIRSLVVPYFGFSAILFLFWFLVRRNFGLSYQTDATVLDVVIQILCGTNSTFFVTPLWFLTCLFMTELCFWGLLRLRKKWLKAVIIAVLYVPGLIYVTYMDLLHLPHLFWNIDQIPFCLYFFALGYVASKWIVVDKWLCLLKNNVGALIVSVLVFALAFVVRENTMSKFLFLFMHTVMIHMGLLAFVVVSKSLKENAVLNFVGQNTITIFALHMIVQSILRGVLFKAFHVAPESLEFSFVAAIAMTIATLTILVPAILFINRFTPWLAGKR